MKSSFDLGTFIESALTDVMAPLPPRRPPRLEDGSHAREQRQGQALCAARNLFATRFVSTEFLINESCRNGSLNEERKNLNQRLWRKASSGVAGNSARAPGRWDLEQRDPVGHQNANARLSAQGFDAFAAHGPLKSEPRLELRKIFETLKRLHALATSRRSRCYRLPSGVDFVVFGRVPLPAGAGGVIDDQYIRREGARMFESALGLGHLVKAEFQQHDVTARMDRQKVRGEETEPMGHSASGGGLRELRDRGRFFVHGDHPIGGPGVFDELAAARTHRNDCLALEVVERREVSDDLAGICRHRDRLRDPGPHERLELSKVEDADSL